MKKKVNMRLVEGDPNEVRADEVLVTYSTTTGKVSGLKGIDFELTDAKVQTNATATITTEVGEDTYTVSIADLLSSGYDALKGTITITLVPGE